MQKALADAGVASRRAADALVAAGRVTVNGLPATTGQRVDPRRDRLALDGRPIATMTQRVYLAMSKPAGVTSTVADRHAERTVLDLVPAHLRGGGRLYPVGRLDRDSEGLLLLSNDGEWAQRLLHPRYGVEREYAVGLAHPLGPDQARALAEGVALSEGPGRLTGLRRASQAEAARLEAPVGSGVHGPRPGERLTWYHAVLRQGWQRQLRRMFAAVGAPVVRLVRVRVGSLRLGSLAPGEVRPLSSAERDRLMADAVRSVPPRVERHAKGGLIVSLDGPGSSGKSSVGAEVAARLGYRFLDTGVLYRALAWLCLDREVDASHDAALVSLTHELELVPDERGRMRRVRVGGRDITRELHAPQVDHLVSRVAARAPLRAALLPLQRGVATEGRIIVAGRDIGTVVLPEADLKLYLDVSIEERAERRAAERGVGPRAAEAVAILADLRRRDELDSGRESAPLRVPRDAMIVRSDGLTFEETVVRVLEVIRERESA